MTAAPSRVGPVSAVVCNYNGEAYLPACLDSLLALDPAPAEILVVDNESTDGSMELLAERYPEITCLPMGRNAGPAAARNAGMRAAQYPWVLALDNDVTLPRHALGDLIAAADDQPDAVLLQPRSVFAGDRERVHYDGGSLHYAGLIALRNFYEPLASAVGRGTVEVDAIISLCLLVDARAVLGAGGYDERYFILFEDLDLSYRLRSEGRRLYCVENTVCVHDEGTAGISFREGPRYPARRVRLHSRNRWMYLGKCYSAWGLLRAAPGLWLYELAQLGFAVQQRALGAYCLGKWDFLRSLPGSWSLRRSVQRRRVLRDRELLVDGPLTLTPAVAASPGKARVARGLNRALTALWPSRQGADS